jgi:glycosyltransferase involved in cell wall biosynthesis
MCKLSELSILIVIPTFNRAHRVKKAVEAALNQRGSGISIVVIDDGSNDNTRAVLSEYFHLPNFTYVQLGRNVGTARAKNVGLALFPFDAITFHDSDDLPHPTKIQRQSEKVTMGTAEASPWLNWTLADKDPGQLLDVSVVLTQHWLISGPTVFKVTRAISLVDDFFPGLQMNAGPPGDWILINSGLFRRSVFNKSGGFEDCIEEDRELRNRLIMQGEIIWLIDEPLLTKYDSTDSLTNSQITGYKSVRRESDRAEVWRRVAHWRATGEVNTVRIDLADLDIAYVSRPLVLKLAHDIPMTAETREHLVAVLHAMESVAVRA